MILLLEIPLKRQFQRYCKTHYLGCYLTAASFTLLPLFPWYLATVFYREKQFVYRDDRLSISFPTHRDSFRVSAKENNNNSCLTSFSKKHNDPNQRTSIITPVLSSGCLTFPFIYQINPLGCTACAVIQAQQCYPSHVYNPKIAGKQI